MPANEPTNVPLPLSLQPTSSATGRHTRCSETSSRGGVRSGRGANIAARVVNLIGEGTLVEFVRVVATIARSPFNARSRSRRNPARTASCCVSASICIDRDDIYGDSVKVAARRAARRADLQRVAGRLEAGEDAAIHPVDFYKSLGDCLGGGYHRSQLGWEKVDHISDWYC